VGATLKQKLRFCLDFRGVCLLSVWLTVANTCFRVEAALQSCRVLNRTFFHDNLYYIHDRQRIHDSTAHWCLWEKDVHHHRVIWCLHFQSFCGPFTVLQLSLKPVGDGNWPAAHRPVYSRFTGAFPAWNDWHNRLVILGSEWATKVTSLRFQQRPF
jgi:hypothetical protein